MTLTNWQDRHVTGTFGERLREAMQRKNWSQKDLARESGITEGAVSRHLERKDAPRVDTVEKYRKALGVTADWLAHGREEVPVESKVITLRGSVALEFAIDNFDWPDIDIGIIDTVCSDARSEAFATGQDRPPAVWKVRLVQLLRERTGRAKEVHRREPTEPVDLTQESPEIRGARKRPKRL